MKKILTIILVAAAFASILLLGGCGSVEDYAFEYELGKVEGSDVVHELGDDATWFMGYRWYVRDARIINTYEEYQDFVREYNEWSAANFTDIPGIDKALGKYTERFFKKNSLIVATEKQSKHGTGMKVEKVEERVDNDSYMCVYIYENIDSEITNETEKASLYFISVNKDEAEGKTEACVRYENNVPTEAGTEAYKPIIYLYPEEETDVCVKLGYKENIVVSYPEYVDGWNVTAEPDGKLVYNETGRNLYSLYYESKNVFDYKIEADGFVVEKANLIEFLEEKLALLGLNEYEAEEFIIYWLPILQQNEYNYIRFATAEEIERNMPLEINPAPDTVIRVMMTFKGLDAPIDVTPQQLETPERVGFVAVEWGGSKIL